MISENPFFRLSLFVGLLVLMFGIETLWPERSWTESRGQRVRFSLSLALVNNLIMKLLIITPFLMWTDFVREQGFGLNQWLKLSGGTEILVTILLFDFFDAVKHLWFHRVAFMWRFHRVHHTDRHLDVLTALRYHPGEMAISAIIKAGWIFIWGPSVIAFMAFEIVLNISSEFHHSNIGLGRWDQWINKIFVTPRYHAIHHTINRAKGDQNFTTIFSLWDKLLGSYTNPQTNQVNLERLGHLQDNHLKLWTVLKSPIIDAGDQGGYLAEDFKSQSEENTKQFQMVKNQCEQGLAIIIDVREHKEIHQHGKIINSIVKPFSEFKAQPKKYIEAIRAEFPTQKVFVYCAVGIRSQRVSNELQKIKLTSENLGGLSDCIKFGLSMDPGHRISV